VVGLRLRGPASAVMASNARISERKYLTGIARINRHGYADDGEFGGGRWAAARRATPPLQALLGFHRDAFLAGAMHASRQLALRPAKS